MPDVALRGYTQGTYDADGVQSPALPAGTAAGDFAFMFMAERESGSPNAAPTDAGWALEMTSTTATGYSKVMTAADITAGVVPTGGAYVAMLQTFTNCRGIGNKSSTNGVTLTEAGAGLVVLERGKITSSTLGPATGKIHASDVTNTANRNRKHNVWFVAHTTTGYKSVALTYPGYPSAFELLPSTGPVAATPLTPAASSQVDPAVANTFSWSGATGQQAYKVRVRVTAGTWYYILADGTLSLTETAVSSATASASLDAAQLTTNTAYGWQVAYTVDGTNWSAWSAEVPFSAITPPVVASVTVTSPAEDLTPLVEATATVGTGSVVAWKVRLCPAADANSEGFIYESDLIVAATLSHVVPVQEWTNAQSLKAWVWVQQTGLLASAWTVDNTAFSVTWTPPTAPSGVTVTAGSPPVISVAGVSGRDVVQVQVSPNGSTDWTDFTTLAVTANPMLVDWPLPTYGAARWVRARVSDTIDGVELWSAWTVTAASFTSTDTAARFVSEDGSAFLAVRIMGDVGTPYTQTIQVSYGLDATTARVDYGRKRKRRGDTTLQVDTQADWDALMAWMDTRDAWLIRWSPEHGPTVADVPPILVARVNELNPERVAQSPVQYRQYVLSWVEQ